MSLLFSTPIFFFFFFFNDTATTEIYTLSLHDALPILDVFEDALQALGGRERVDRAEARVRDDHDLAGLDVARSEEHTSELQSLAYLVCRLLLEKKKKKTCIARIPRSSSYTCPS